MADSSRFVGEIGGAAAAGRRVNLRTASDRIAEAAAVVAERGGPQRDFSIVDWPREISLTILAGDALVVCRVLDLAEVEASLLARIGAASGIVDHAFARIEDAHALLDAGMVRCAAPPIGERVYDESVRAAGGAAAASMPLAAILVHDWLGIRLMAQAIALRAEVAALSPTGRSFGSAEGGVGSRILKRARLGQMSPVPEVAMAAAESLILEGRAALATARARRAKAQRLRLRLKAKRGGGVAAKRAVVDNGPELPDLLGTDVPGDRIDLSVR